ncbi:phage minor head protein [Desulfohalovibrio reitneri]|uniref:phage minor head protein n=1 Tax=Desulfohalovibrio reitneri TaxID=1307759 RepID=UPI0004A75286|nr:phage minor head protein [Desulfohalovibrio reitneri]
MPVSPPLLPFQEARDYWASKGIVTRKEFDRLEGVARSRAFTVSGLARMDQLAEVHSAIGHAVENGESLADFKTRVRGLIERKGWSSWRVETIFRNNVQSAYMAGRHAQMMRAAQARPYWRYVAVKDSRTRPSHLALNGMVYRHEHPFWKQFYPPNGHRCRCSVVTLSGRQVEARGYQVEEDMPDMVEPIDPATGEKLPPVRPWPDKGFATNVGESWTSGVTPEPIRLDDIKPVATRTICRDGHGLFADDPCKPPLADLDRRHVLPVEEGDLLEKGLQPEVYVKTFLAEFGLNSLDGETVHRLHGGLPLPINKWFFVDKATRDWKVTSWKDKGPYMKLLARTIKRPFEIWQITSEIRGKPVQSIRLVRLFARQGKDIGGFCVWHLLDGKWASATAFSPKAERSPKAILEYLERMREGILLFREKLT